MSKATTGWSILNKPCFVLGQTSKLPRFKDLLQTTDFRVKTEQKSKAAVNKPLRVDGTFPWCPWCWHTGKPDSETPSNQFWTHSDEHSLYGIKILKQINNFTCWKNLTDFHIQSYMPLAHFSYSLIFHEGSPPLKIKSCGIFRDDRNIGFEEGTLVFKGIVNFIDRGYVLLKREVVSTTWVGEKRLLWLQKIDLSPVAASPWGWDPGLCPQTLWTFWGKKL